MNIYDVIETEGTVNETLIPLLFGNKKDKYAPLRRPLTIPLISHDVCVFYCALLQIHIVDIAKRNSKKITELYPNKRFSKTIMDIWHDAKVDLHAGSNAVSFIKDAITTVDNPEYFGKDLKDALNDVNDDYNNLVNKDLAVSPETSKEHLLNLLRNMPLLRTTEICDGETITDEFGTYNSIPFIMIRKESLFITTSATKGECNTQLYLNQREIDGDGTILYKDFFVTDNEDLIIFCQALDLDVKWYDQKQYLGNCRYVVNLAQLLSHCICSAIKEKENREGRGTPPDILPKLKYYFRYSKMYNELKDLEKRADFTISTNGEIRYKDKSRKNKGTLSNIMMGFIIKYGAFITVHDFFFDGSSKLMMEKNDPDDDYGEINAVHIFNDIAINYIEKEKLSKYPDPREIVKKYISVINNHLVQLEKIVRKEDNAYKIRSDYIKAEQRTC